MSDDLVKRLRDTPNWMREGFQDWKDNVRTYDRAPFEAADRIEELIEEGSVMAQKLDSAEAKLAKAVDLGFDECPFRDGTGSYEEWWHDRRKQFESLKGQNDE